MDFEQKWAEHKVSTLQPARLRINDERVGVIETEWTVMLSPTSRQRLMLLQPTAGTDSAERLARLLALIPAPRR